MYLALPSTSHVTSGLAGSSTMPSRAAGSQQSRAWNSSVSSGVIHARSVGSFGAVAPADGLAVGEGFALGDGLDDGLAAGLGVGVAAVSASGTALLLVGEALLAVVGRGRAATGSRSRSPYRSATASAAERPAATASTGRNWSWEDRLIASRTSWVGISGMLTTMLRSPCVVTSAPDTPPASTRWTMMSRAWLSCSAETRLPAVVLRLEDDLGAALEVEAELGVELGVGPEVAPRRGGRRGRGRRRGGPRGTAWRWTAAEPPWSGDLGRTHADGPAVVAQGRPGADVEGGDRVVERDDRPVETRGRQHLVTDRQRLLERAGPAGSVAAG